MPVPFSKRITPQPGRGWAGTRIPSLTIEVLQDSIGRMEGRRSQGCVIGRRTAQLRRSVTDRTKGKGGQWKQNLTPTIANRRQLCATRPGCVDTPHSPMDAEKTVSALTQGHYAAFDCRAEATRKTQEASPEKQDAGRLGNRRSERDRRRACKAGEVDGEGHRAYAGTGSALSARKRCRGASGTISEVGSSRPCDVARLGWVGRKHVIGEHHPCPVLEAKQLG